MCYNKNILVDKRGKYMWVVWMICIGCEKQRESIRNACGAFGDCADIPGCSAWNEEIGTILCHCMASVRREFHGGGTLFLMSAKEKEAPSKMAFTFLAPLVNEQSARADSRARQARVRELIEEEHFFSAKEKRKGSAVEGGKRWNRL